MTPDKGSDGSKFFYCFCATSQIRLAPKYVHAEESKNHVINAIFAARPSASIASVKQHRAIVRVSLSIEIIVSTGARQKATTPQQHARLNYQNKNCPSVSLSPPTGGSMSLFIFFWMRAHDRALWKTTSRVIRGARLLNKTSTLVDDKEIAIKSHCMKLCQ